MNVWYAVITHGECDIITLNRGLEELKGFNELLIIELHGDVDVGNEFLQSMTDENACHIGGADVINRMNGICLISSEVAILRAGDALHSRMTAQGVLPKGKGAFGLFPIRKRSRSESTSKQLWAAAGRACGLSPIVMQTLPRAVECAIDSRISKLA